MIIRGVDPVEQAAMAWAAQTATRCEMCGRRSESRSVGGGRWIVEQPHNPGCPDDELECIEVDTTDWPGDWPAPAA